MNNSKIAFDNLAERLDADRSAFLAKQKGELSQVLEAIRGVEQTSDWQKLKRLVLDEVVNSLERQLSSEALKKEINTSELYRLQGQLVWAKRYTDLAKLAELFRTQIEHITLQIQHEQTNPRDGAL